MKQFRAWGKQHKKRFQLNVTCSLRKYWICVPSDPVRETLRKFESPAFQIKHFWENQLTFNKKNKTSAEVVALSDSGRHYFRESVNA